MQPFQSHLFNWIYHSPPFQWGRRVRLLVHQWSAQVPDKIQQIWEKTIKPLSDFLSPAFPHQDNAQLPPWQRAMATRISSTISTPPSDLDHPQQNEQTLRVDNAPDRLRRLLEAAFTYFSKRPKFSKVASQKELQLLENEQGPWPIPPQLFNPYIDNPTSNLFYEYDGIVAAPDRSAEISAWVAEEEAEEQPLHAWIETHATSLGYAYGPIMEFLYGLDRWIACVESWFGKIWQKLRRWFKL